MGNLVTAVHEGVLVVVTNALPPTTETWDAYMEQLRKQFEVARGAPVGLLIFAGGGTPDASMRTKLRQAIAQRPIRTAIVSDSVMVRGVVGIISLFVPSSIPFAPREWAKALAHVGYPADRVAQLRLALRPLYAEVKGCAPLAPLLDEPAAASSA